MHIQALAISGLLLSVLTTFPTQLYARELPALVDELCRAQESADLGLRPILNRGDIEIYEEELRAFLSTIPKRHLAYYVKSDHLLERLQQLSISRLIAHDAIEQGILEDPLVMARVSLVLGDVLAEARREQIREPKSLEKFERRAEELYLTDPNQFRDRGNVSFKHLLISSADRTEAEAARLILDVYDRLQSGEGFSELISELSEDGNQPEGGYQRSSLEKWPEKFSQILNRAEPGSSVLGPFSTSEGWHLVRLTERHEGEVPDWEESKDQIIQMVAREHHEDALRRYIRDISEPVPELDEEALERIREELSN